MATAIPELNDGLKLERASPIDLGHLPEAEREAANHLIFLLDELRGFYDSFVAGVVLIDFCREERSSLAHNWMFLGCREATFSAWHIGETIRAIRSGFKDCPTFVKYVDTNALKNQEAAYKAFFPEIAKSRNAVAHLANLMQTPQHKAQNSGERMSTLNGINVVFGGREGLHNWIYLDAIDGQIVSIDLNPSRLAEFRTLIKLVIAAFSPKNVRDDI
jgi:hypothetical protein